MTANPGESGLLSGYNGSCRGGPEAAAGTEENNNAVCVAGKVAAEGYVSSVTGS